MFILQTCDWYRSSHPVLGKKANKHISQNVGLFCFSIIMVILISGVQHVWSFLEFSEVPGVPALVLAKFVCGWRYKMYSKAVGLTRTHMIMTFILSSEGDQMLQVFSCQATPEHRAQQRSWRRRGVGSCLSSVLLHYSQWRKSNLTTFLGEKALCVSQGYQCLGRCVSYGLGAVCELQLLGAQGHCY